MADKNIYILSAPSKVKYSGSLIEWISKRKNADGIILISSENEKQFIVYSSKEKMIINSQEGYDWANEKLIEVSKQNPNWIVVDGIGNNEVRGGGFFESITTIIEKAKRFTKMNVLFIVPQELVEIFIDYFNIDIKNGKIITIAELMKLKHG